LSVAISVIYQKKIKKIINELSKLEQELCIKNKTKLRKVVENIREEFNLKD
jgi:hypothetical protein